MKAISAKLNTYVHSISVINNNIERFFLNLILWSFVTLSILYVLCLGNMVKNIVERKGLENEARSLSTDVANMELTYLSLSNNVDMNLSHSLGFKETKATFATSKPVGILPTHNSSVAQNDI